MCEIITLYAIFDDDGNVYDICHEPCESMMDGNYDSKKQIEDTRRGFFRCLFLDVND
jgi:hypothetical protein